MFRTKITGFSLPYRFSLFRLSLSCCLALSFELSSLLSLHIMWYIQNKFFFWFIANGIYVDTHTHTCCNLHCICYTFKNRSYMRIVCASNYFLKWPGPNGICRCDVTIFKISRKTQLSNNCRFLYNDVIRTIHKLLSSNYGFFMCNT